MIIDGIERGTLRSAVELAVRAPSVHNSQPWRFLLGPRSVHLHADRARRLPVTDADGRDLVLSCGAALHHLRVALAAERVRARVHRIPRPDTPDHLAALEVTPGQAPERDLALASAIPRRRSDRRPFTDWPVPEPFLARLTEAAAGQGVLLRAITEGHARAVLTAAIREAATAQDLTPGYRTELAMWSGRRSSDDGVPAANLLRETPARSTGRDFGAGELETGAHEDGATLVVLGTASDDTLSWLRAGEALSAVTLLATELDLATCPLSQPLEIGATRRVLRDEVLDGSLSPQVVLRLGWPPAGGPLPATPRRPVAEVLGRLEVGRVPAPRDGRP